MTDEPTDVPADSPSPSRSGVQEAFRQAVDRECAALHTHESAAERHESTANHYDNAADGLDMLAAARLRGLARVERLRAQHARARADAVRQRLIRDGLDPETEATDPPR